MSRHLPRLLLGLSIAGASLVAADRSAVPVSAAPTRAPTPVVSPAEQRLYQPGRTLIAPEHAQAVLAAFRETYAALGEPRLVIYVNRELVDTRGTLRAGETAPPTLADRQTMRDIERLFGRPLRAGGARLADPRVIAALMDDRPLDDMLALSRDDARRERAALRAAADVVIEVLISSRSVTLPSWAGDDTRLVPDLQVTAIRLSDGAILAQASATDILGRDREMGPIVRHFDVRDIAEATALALMEDFTLNPPRLVDAP